MQRRSLFGALLAAVTPQAAPAVQPVQQAPSDATVPLFDADEIRRVAGFDLFQPSARELCPAAGDGREHRWYDHELSANASSETSWCTCGAFRLRSLWRNPPIDFDAFVRRKERRG